jgi:PAS domain S-box-containing protein
MMSGADRQEVKAKDYQVSQPTQTLVDLIRSIAWLPVVIFFITIIVLAFIHIDVAWNPPNLLKVLNITFLTIITFLVSLLAARSYLGNHSSFFLLFGCGMLALGFGGTLGALPLGKPVPNWTVTVYNLSAFLSGLCIMISAIEGWSVKPWRLKSGWPVLLSFYLGIMVIEFILAVAVRNELLPVFFIDGRGATIYDLLSLWTTAGLFTASAILLRFNYGASKSNFYYWCTLGFVLIAVGLLGVSLQTKFGSPLNWTSRFSQYLGGVYLLIATISSVRQSGTWILPLEKALRESEARYRSLVESSPDGILVHRNGRFLFANSVALKMYGADTLEQLQTKTVPDLIHPDDRDAIKARMQMALVEQKVPLRETKMMSLDGRVIPVETVGSMVDFQGEPAVQIIIRDITERKQSEESLRESEERFRAIISSTPDHILVQDRELRYTFVVNPQLGMSEQDMIGKTDFDFLLKEDAETLTRIKRQVLETGKPIHLEMPVTSPQGSQQFFNGSYIPKFDSQGQIDGLIGYFRNVTELIQAGEALRESEEKYRTIVETANEGIWITGPKRETILINQRMAEMLGCTIEEMIGRTPSEYLDEDQERLALKVRDQLKAGKETHEEFKLHRKDGSILWVISNATPMYDSEGHFKGTLSMLSDITKRKHAEEDLNSYREHLEELIMQRTQELEDKNLQLHKEMIERIHAEEEKNKLEIQLIQAQRMEALGKLAGGIAHDLNNILQPILINSEILSDKLPQGTLEREYLDQIIEVAQLGKNLTKQIKLYGSSQKPMLKPIPISQVVHKALTIVKRTLSSDIKLNQHLPMNEHLVNADSIQINQLVLNLCSNAFQSMSPQGGTLDVSLDETVVTQPTVAIGNDLNPGKYMKLTVSDTGSGINPEIMKNIFDPFFTTREADKGTGLGLAVVYEIVKNSQGSLLQYSEVGKGTRFEVFFPLNLDSQN